MTLNFIDMSFTLMVKQQVGEVS